MLQVYELEKIMQMIYIYICFVNRVFVHCKHFILRPPSPVMSENYIVFIEQPIKLDMLRFMLYRIQGQSVHRLMTWEPQCETIFHLVNRHTGKVGSGWFCSELPEKIKKKLQANLFTHGVFP